MRTLTTLGLVLFAGCVGPGLPVAVNSAQQMQFTDGQVWRWHDDQLELFGSSAYQPPHRSPLSLAILREVEFGDFDLTVEALSTKAEYGHRDLLVVFAYRDPAHFAYAHLASVADPNAHQVMLVADAPRRPVTIERTQGVVWGDVWHELRVTRRGERVEVFFDGERVMTAMVPADRGRVGVGSFDDTGIFRRLVVTPH